MREPVRYYNTLPREFKHLPPTPTQPNPHTQIIIGKNYK